MLWKLRESSALFWPSIIWWCWAHTIRETLIFLFLVVKQVVEMFLKRFVHLFGSFFIFFKYTFIPADKYDSIHPRTSSIPGPCRFGLEAYPIPSRSFSTASQTPIKAAAPASLFKITTTIWLPIPFANSTLHCIAENNSPCPWFSSWWRVAPCRTGRETADRRRRGRCASTARGRHPEII